MVASLHFDHHRFDSLQSIFKICLVKNTSNNGSRNESLLILHLKIQQFYHSYLNSQDLIPKRIEVDMEQAVQNFFVQIMPSTFLCMTGGSCLSITQSYANCIQKNSISWKIFYGDGPNKMAISLRQDILKYRIIEKSIDKLYR